MIINSYDFGKIIMDGKHYTTDLLVFLDKIKADWWRKEGHRLQIADLKEVIEVKLEVMRAYGGGVYRLLKNDEGSP